MCLAIGMAEAESSTTAEDTPWGNTNIRITSGVSTKNFFEKIKKVLQSARGFDILMVFQMRDRKENTLDFTGIVHYNLKGIPKIWIVENPEYILLPDDTINLREEKLGETQRDNRICRKPLFPDAHT